MSAPTAAPTPAVQGRRSARDTVTRMTEVMRIVGPWSNKYPDTASAPGRAGTWSIPRMPAMEEALPAPAAPITPAAARIMLTEHARPPREPAPPAMDAARRRRLASPLAVGFAIVRQRDPCGAPAPP